MMTTITVVVTVSRPVGHATRAVSARTCRINSPGVVRAIMSLLFSVPPAKTRRPESRIMAFWSLE